MIFVPCFFCMSFLTTLALLGNHGVPPCLDRKTKVFLLLASVLPPILWMKILVEWQKEKHGYLVSIPVSIVVMATVVSVLIYFDSNEESYPLLWLVPFLLVESVTAIVFIKAWKFERAKVAMQESS